MTERFDGTTVESLHTKHKHKYSTKQDNVQRTQSLSNAVSNTLQDNSIQIYPDDFDLQVT